MDGSSTPIDAIVRPYIFATQIKKQPFGTDLYVSPEVIRQRDRCQLALNQLLAPMKEIEEIGFWKWAFSDLLSNALRGVLAEYIVATAVGCTHRPRTEWDAFDLETIEGLKIEVKSSAYLQSWAQKAHSPIRFDIAPKKGWSAATNTSAIEASRSANVYVFCVFAAKEKAIANPRNLSQWFFLACPAQLLNERFGAQKSVALSALQAIGLQQLSFQELGLCIQQLGANNSFKADVTAPL